MARERLYEGDSMLEYEKKIILTCEEYAVILELFKNASFKTQINYYFDTEDMLMNKKGITCRIRAKNGTYKATVKNHFAKDKNCSCEVTVSETRNVCTDVFDALGLFFQGELVTSRTILFKNEFCEAVLDANTYLGLTDYEIEVEYLKGHEKTAIEFLKRIAGCLLKANLIDSAENFLMRDGKSKSKSERFFEKKKLII